MADGATPARVSAPTLGVILASSTVLGAIPANTAAPTPGVIIFPSTTLGAIPANARAVSYTHLTLPTILRV